MICSLWPVTDGYETTGILGHIKDGLCFYWLHLVSLEGVLEDASLGSFLCSHKSHFYKKQHFRSV